MFDLMIRYNPGVVDAWLQYALFELNEALDAGKAVQLYQRAVNRASGLSEEQRQEFAMQYELRK